MFTSHCLYGKLKDLEENRHCQKQHFPSDFVKLIHASMHVSVNAVSKQPGAYTSHLANHLHSCSLYNCKSKFQRLFYFTPALTFTLKLLFLFIIHTAIYHMKRCEINFHIHKLIQAGQSQLNNAYRIFTCGEDDTSNQEPCIMIFDV